MWGKLLGLKKQGTVYLFIAVVLPAIAADGYVGSGKCAQCHADIARSQSTTRMARTWHGAMSSVLAPAYAGRKSESDLVYTIHREENAISFSVRNALLGSLTAPVETIVGGPRHGISFLARLQDIGGETLARPVLVETRYLYSTPHRRLELSPGFSKEVPASWETAVGRVLAPVFEKRCLTCHGAALNPRLAETGVRCESCHGPGEAHVASIQKGKAGDIVNPAKFSNEQKIAQCGVCHGDARPLADALPADLLISHQMEALTHSECYVQSGAGLSCSTCHNPHSDEPGAVAASEKVCGSCHSSSAKPHAAICPVNQKSGCVTCHMQTTQSDTFQMVDHWIRAVPAKENPRKVAAMRSQVAPKREFLRLISVEDRAKAEELRAQAVGGASFFDLARRNSTGPSALSGGYLGDVEVAKLAPALRTAALPLSYGELSPVVETAGQFVILQRLPRDFRWRANELFEEGQSLRQRGFLDAAVAKYQAALQLYPHFLRALVFLGSAISGQGDAGRATAILEHAVKLYPDDTGALYNLGIAYGAGGRGEDERKTYERAIALDPDLTLAYINLGAALFAAGKLDGAAEVFEQGLRTNPLSARLYYNLSLVREQQGRNAEAARLMRVVKAIDPRLTGSDLSVRKPEQH